MLRSKLNIEPETDLGLYLGCVLSKGSAKLNDDHGHHAQGILKGK